jgi:hypothetical protein
MRAFLLASAALFFLSGCISQEALLRGKNYTRIHIPETRADEITTAAAQIFASHGFQPAPATTPQELVLAKNSPAPLRFIKGGNAIVWLVLEPRGLGWDVYCVPEPDHLYPGKTALRFDPVLRELQAKFDKNPAQPR